MSVEHSTWTVERDYPHSPEQVFAAWADTSVKVRWFDLSATPDPDYRNDFRVGGAETFYMAPGTSPRFTYDAQYRDIVDNERIVNTYEMAMDGRRISVSLATVELTATESGTHLVFTEQGAYLDGLDSAESRRTGTSTQLDALANVLKEQA
jgi:uncharacterized protein YndB with AHSA1/START domain